MTELFRGPHLDPGEQEIRRRFDVAVSAAYQAYRQEARLPKKPKGKARVPAVFPAWDHYQQAMSLASAEYDRAMGITEPEAGSEI